MKIYNQSNKKIYTAIFDVIKDNLNNTASDPYVLTLRFSTSFRHSGAVTVDAGKSTSVTLRNVLGVRNHYVFLFESKSKRDAFNDAQSAMDYFKLASVFADVLINRKVGSDINVLNLAGEFTNSIRWKEFGKSSFAQKQGITGVAVLPKGGDGSDLWVVYWDKDQSVDYGEMKDFSFKKINAVLGGPPNSTTRNPNVYGQFIDPDNPQDEIKVHILVQDSFLDFDEGDNHFVKHVGREDANPAVWIIRKINSDWSRVYIIHEATGMYLHDSEKYGPLARGRSVEVQWAFYIRITTSDYVNGEDAKSMYATFILPQPEKGNPSLISKYHKETGKAVKKFGPGGGVILGDVNDKSGSVLTEIYTLVPAGSLPDVEANKKLAESELVVENV